MIDCINLLYKYLYISCDDTLEKYITRGKVKSTIPKCIDPICFHKGKFTNIIKLIKFHIYTRVSHKFISLKHEILLLDYQTDFIY